jgi:hypothetical protein
MSLGLSIRMANGPAASLRTRTCTRTQTNPSDWNGGMGQWPGCAMGHALSSKLGSDGCGPDAGWSPKW